MKTKRGVETRRVSSVKASQKREKMCKLDFPLSVSEES